MSNPAPSSVTLPLIREVRAGGPPLVLFPHVTKRVTTVKVSNYEFQFLERFGPNGMPQPQPGLIMGPDDEVREASVVLAPQGTQEMLSLEAWDNSETSCVSSNSVMSSDDQPRGETPEKEPSTPKAPEPVAAPTSPTSAPPPPTVELERNPSRSDDEWETQTKKNVRSRSLSSASDATSSRPTTPKPKVPTQPRTPSPCRRTFPHPPPRATPNPSPRRVREVRSYSHIHPPWLGRHLDWPAPGGRSRMPPIRPRVSRWDPMYTTDFTRRSHQRSHPYPIAYYTPEVPHHRQPWRDEGWAGSGHHHQQRYHWVAAKAGTPGRNL